MARSFYVLTDRDREALVGLVRQQYRQTGLHRSGSSTPEDPGTSPDVYAALTPVGGIPARVGDQLGAAECIIYRSVDGQLVALDGVLRTVNNLTTSSIPGETWVKITRDKFGTWYADQISESASVNNDVIEQVEITSTTKTDDRYPGKIHTYDPATKVWTESTDIWVVGNNDGELETEIRYPAEQYDETNGRLVFVAFERGLDSGATTNLQVSYTDGTGLNSTVAILRFDKAKGFQLSASGTTENVTIQEASRTQTGVVTSVAQEFSSNKYFGNAFGGGDWYLGNQTNRVLWVHSPSEASGYVQFRAMGVGANFRAYTYLELGTYVSTGGGAWSSGQALCVLYGTNDTAGATPINPAYAIKDNTVTTHVGKWGTLPDGSVVKGGIITTISTDIPTVDGGTF